MSFEEKNSGKYLTTFPYPYMNGYLHLGKTTYLFPDHFLSSRTPDLF